MRVTGWDIGGANVKAAHVTFTGGLPSVRTVSRPFEIWKGPGRLPDVLRAAATELPASDLAAVTMTAELSDAFRTKREGVGLVLDAVAAITTGTARVFTTAGTFLEVPTARVRPLEVAASNWMATALLAARHGMNGILVDVGSTTTDVTSIREGQVMTAGRTDPDRLLAGELVYTGALRTNVAAIVSRAPLRGQPCPVASELFAVSGDAHVVLGHLEPADYTCPTPDGRPPAAPYAAERLARVVCADSDMLEPREIVTIARAVADAQVDQIATALARAARRFPAPPDVVVTGLGAFLARRAAGRFGLGCRDLATALGVDVGLAAPAVAVAWLLAAEGAGPA
jgi:probable H4MPT-linked C1 transfer pathway protein